MGSYYIILKLFGDLHELLSILFIGQVPNVQVTIYKILLHNKSLLGSLGKETKD